MQCKRSVASFKLPHQKGFGRGSSLDPGMCRSRQTDQAQQAKGKLADFWVSFTGGPTGPHYPAQGGFEETGQVRTFFRGSFEQENMFLF